MGLDQALSMRILTLGRRRFLKPRAARQIRRAEPDATVPERGVNCQPGHGWYGRASAPLRSRHGGFRPASSKSLAGP